MCASSWRRAPDYIFFEWFFERYFERQVVQKRARRLETKLP